MCSLNNENYIRECRVLHMIVSHPNVNSVLDITNLFICFSAQFKQGQLDFWSKKVIIIMTSIPTVVSHKRSQQGRVIKIEQKPAFADHFLWWRHLCNPTG